MPLPEEDDEPDADPTIIATIAIINDEYRVLVVTPVDGELAEVTILGWDGTSLALSWYFPSTDWTSKNIFTALPNGNVEVEYAWGESRRKVPLDSIYKEPEFHKPAVITETGPTPFDTDLLGIWELDDEDGFISVVLILIEKNASGYEISTFDDMKGVAFETRNACWDGEALSFEVYDEFDNCMSKNCLTPRNDESADHQLIQWNHWQKLPAPQA